MPLTQANNIMHYPNPFSLFSHLFHARQTNEAVIKPTQKLTATNRSCGADAFVHQLESRNLDVENAQGLRNEDKYAKYNKLG